MGGRADDGAATDEPVLAVERDVRLVPEHRYGDSGPWPLFRLPSRSHLGPLQRKRRFDSPFWLTL